MKMHRKNFSDDLIRASITQGLLLISGLCKDKNKSTCSDWGLNPQPLAHWVNTFSTKPPSQGLNLFFEVILKGYTKTQIQG